MRRTFATSWWAASRSSFTVTRGSQQTSISFWISRRLDAVLDDGTTVHVVRMDDLRSLKQTTGRPKDLDDIEKLDQIAHAMLEEDDDGG
jgi:hypothetical protein